MGTVPGILNLPFANVTPFQSAAVNYTSANPPFAGVYGHPWGFDAGSHPNAAGAAASAYESIRAFDNTPVQGGGGDPTFTPVTGQPWTAHCLEQLEDNRIIRPNAEYVGSEIREYKKVGDR